MSASLLASVSGRVLNIAHRGAVEGVPPNSLAGIREALRVGADAIELDVQATRDHVPILFHDERIAVGDKTRRVGEMTLDELDDLLRASSGRPSAPVARLDEVFDCLRETGAAAVLDIKVRDVVDVVMRMIRDWQLGSRILIASFDYWPLRRAKALEASVPTIATAGFSRVMQDPGPFLWTLATLSFPVLAARLVGADAIMCPAYRTTRQLVWAAHGAGLAVFVWDITGTARVADLVALGVDGLVNDAPEGVRRELDRAPMRPM